MKILGICDRFDWEILECISDKLLERQTVKNFYLSESNCDLDMKFSFYATCYSLKEYIKENFENEKEFIQAINNYRDIHGVCLSIEGTEVRVIASDDELKLIYDNQPEPVCPKMGPRILNEETGLWISGE